MLKFLARLIALILTISPLVLAADNLHLNPHLDYSSDSQDGPLITGDDMQSVIAQGKPAYIIMFGEACYNSKRQARRTVHLYEKYKGRVQFVVIDLDQRLTPAQDEIRKKYFHGYIPHVVVLNASGASVYNSSGEVEESVIGGLLDKALQ